MGDRIIAYRALVGRSEEKMPLGRPRSRWWDNIKTDLQYAGWSGTRTVSIWLRIGAGGGCL